MAQRLSSVLGSLAVLASCGRLEFEPEDRDPSISGEPGVPDTCAGARVISTSFDILTVSLAGAHDNVATAKGCGAGPEIVLRFDEAARGAWIVIHPRFDGHYALGTGCPIREAMPHQCGTLTALASPLKLRADVTADTYLILSHPVGTHEGANLLIGDAAL